MLTGVPRRCDGSALSQSQKNAQLSGAAADNLSGAGKGGGVSLTRLAGCGEHHHPMGSIWRALAGAGWLWCSVAPARAAGEPGVRELQEAAIRYAALEPHRLTSLLQRLRTAAWAPRISLRFGGGARQLEALTATDGFQRLSSTAGDGWTLEAAATWSLDRLIFDGDELRASRENERMAAHRERLLREITHLYFERQRWLQRAPLGTAGGDEAMALQEMTALLDGLTGGALTAPRGAP